MREASGYCRPVARRAPRRRPSTPSNMAAAPFASIPTAAPSRFPASMTIAVAGPKRSRNDDTDRSRTTRHPKRPRPTRSNLPTIPRSCSGSGRNAPRRRHPIRRRRPQRHSRCSPSTRSRRAGGGAIDHNGSRNARGYRRDGNAAGASGPAGSGSGPSRPKPAPAPVVAAAPPAAAPAPAPAAVQAANSPLGLWLTEEKEGKVQDRAMRRQSLRLFSRQEIEPERRAGSDQHEARQGRQMERPDSRSEHRQHL